MPMFLLHEGFEERIAQELPRLESLVADLRALSTGWQPGPEHLADAPLMVNPRFGYVQDVCLEGPTTGHPKLGNQFITTSKLWVCAPLQGWARTYSRFYRIQRCAEAPRDY